MERKNLFLFFAFVSFGLWPPFPLSNWGQTRVCWLSWTRKGSRLIFRRACNTKPTRTVGQKYKGERFSFFSFVFLTRALAATHNSLHFFGLSRLILNSLLSGLLAFTTFFLILRKRKKRKSGCCSAPCELGKEGGWFWGFGLGAACSLFSMRTASYLDCGKNVMLRSTSKAKYSSCLWLAVWVVSLSNEAAKIRFCCGPLKRGVGQIQFWQAPYLEPPPVPKIRSLSFLVESW